jgi:hypothetical protein
VSDLLILCEGDTEQEVLTHFLRPFWEKRFDSANVLNYRGNGGLKNNFARDTHRELNKAPELSILCLVDLYEEPFGLFRGKMTRAEGFEAVRAYIYSLVDSRFHHRFGAFPIVMEIETWLLADEKAMAKYGGQSDPNPEMVEHPAERLKKLRPNYNNRINGKNLFGFASAKRVYDDNCAHFRLLADWLTTPPKPSPPLPNLAQEKLEAWEQERNNLQLRLEKLEQDWEQDPSDGNMDSYLHTYQALDYHVNITYVELQRSFKG